MKTYMIPEPNSPVAQGKKAMPFADLDALRRTLPAEVLDAFAQYAAISHPFIIKGPTIGGTDISVLVGTVEKIEALAERLTAGAATARSIGADIVATPMEVPAMHPLSVIVLALTCDSPDNPVTNPTAPSN